MVWRAGDGTAPSAAAAVGDLFVQSILRLIGYNALLWRVAVVVKIVGMAD